MVGENLRLNSSNVVRIEGYFYHIDPSADVLFKKVDDGTNAFSYPLDTPITGTVISLEHDGRYFWTLENSPSANGGNGRLLFKKWEISNNVLKHRRTYTLNGTASKKYDCEAFSVEHFHRTLDNSVSQSGTVLDLGTDGNLRIESGDILIIGPSTFAGYNGLSEEKAVLTTSGINNEYVVLNSPLSYSYDDGDTVISSKRIWFFNKFQPNDADPTNGSGQLYSFVVKDLSTTVLARTAGNEFNDVLAATYLTVDAGTPSERDYLAFMRETNLLFVETDDNSTDVGIIVKSAAQNNQRTDNTVIPVYELTHEDDTIFRLQQEATYRIGGSESTESYSPDYNYQLTTLTRLPTSISLTADPAIISADGTSTSTITAIVKDQFDDPIGGQRVEFTDDDTGGTDPGQVNPDFADTNAFGIATTEYEAGTEANLVTITARAVNVP